MQSINLPGTSFFLYARFVRKRLLIPHFWIPNINHMNPEYIKWKGIEGIISDHDNTLVKPYETPIYKTIEEKFYEFKDVFGDRFAIMSNKAGTRDDQEDIRARTIEEKLGVNVIRHRMKKPCGIRAVREYFTKVLGHECNPTKLMIIGDHPPTDIILGNRHGMITVLTEELEKTGDNKLQSRIKRYVKPLMIKWKEKGLRAPPHKNYDHGMSHGGILY